MLRSLTKEFFDVTAEFSNTLKSLAFWQLFDSTSSNVKQINSGLSAADNNFIYKFSNLVPFSYREWLNGVWNVPDSVINSELGIVSDFKTKRLFLGLDKIPKRALVFSGHEKNNFSTYYSCNSLAFSKLITFYFEIFNSNCSFQNLTKLFNKSKQIAKTQSALNFYNKKLIPLLNQNLNKLFFTNFIEKWSKMVLLYGVKVTKFLFFFTLKLAISQNKKNNFWNIFNDIYKKFQYYFYRSLNIPFLLIFFFSSRYKIFFGTKKNELILKHIFNFIRFLPSYRDYTQLSTLSRLKKKLF